jgi:putative flippase GtrA
MKSFKGEAFRFLVAGALNTAATYVLYLALLQIVPYRVAYTVSYAIGIVLAYAINTLFVFRSAWNWRRLLAFPLVYVVQYALGVLVLTLLVEPGFLSERLAPLGVVAITIPFTFLASRYLIKGRSA